MLVKEFSGVGLALMKQARINHGEKVEISIEPCEEPPGKFPEHMIPKNVQIRYRPPVVQVKNEDVNILKSLFTRRATKLFMGTKPLVSIRDGSVASNGQSPLKRVKT